MPCPIDQSELLPKRRFLLLPRRRELQHLTVRDQARPQLVIRHVLDCDAGLDRHGGGGGGGLPQNHEDRLHADGPICDVRTGDAHRHKQIGGLALLGHQRAV